MYAQCGMISSNFYIYSHLNDVDETTKVIPIMLTIANGNTAVIRDLLLCDINLSNADYQGNNVFHYAAKTSDSQIIQVCTSECKVRISNCQSDQSMMLYILTS